ncbi:glycosyl hydrolase family 18 protein [Metabacillus sp. B2-18]|uniref:glycosyl hydrolase family 18 protein n=1 Tax=Metabacillus sp. B2-18 TaxID=2897333 RepID=UPI001E3A38D6|nr:glycosyl hydrolase family 18 protein [Metabacillus sp. B2-18]UGB30477.1 glycosyl hydrolase family 18 protein [Metabacillus sp. B2-18]
MELFERHKIITTDNEVVITLYLDSFSTEFSSELGFKGKIDDLHATAKEYIQKRFPDIKHATVKVVAGVVLVSAFSLHTTQKASAHVADFNMTYLYFGNTKSYISQIDRTGGNLNLVSPSYFDLNSDGSLKLTSQVDKTFVNEMHNRGIKVVPFLSNHWDRTLGRTALANREQLSQQIADAIVTYNLDGVQVDIENVTDVDRDNYTDLVRLLREKIPADKEVSVAVAANPYGWNKGWHGSYDYKQLAQYSSYIMIMAYDESFQGSPEGPVASLSFVENSIKYALGEEVPPEKIVLGIPFYGRYWKQGESYGGYGLSNSRVSEITSKYKTTTTYDTKSQSPMMTFEVKSTDPIMTVAGRTLTAGTYHLWYENERSIQAKVNLVHKYGLKGTGSWSLGQEDPSIWENYRAWLTTHTTTVDSDQSPAVEEPAGDSTTYVVRGGDTLSSIAKKFGLTVTQLKEYNSLTTDVIYIGQLLYLVPNEENTPIIIPNTALPTNHGQIIGRLYLKEDTQLLKKQPNGSYFKYKLLKKGEVINVFGAQGNKYDVGGGYYIEKTDRMSLHIGRLLIKNREVLYKPDGTFYRYLEKGEAIKVFSYDENKYNVGGGYYIKPTDNVLFYEGFLKPKSYLTLYKPNGAVHRHIRPDEYIRVYSIDGDRFYVGGGYYIKIDRNLASFVRH